MKKILVAIDNEMLLGQLKKCGKYIVYGYDIDNKENVIEYLKPGDCLVLNNTKVIPARLLGVKEDTGAAVEVLLLKRKEGDVWETLVKPGKKCRPGARLSFGDGILKAEVLEVVEEGNRGQLTDMGGFYYQLYTSQFE